MPSLSTSPEYRLHDRYPDEAAASATMAGRCLRELSRDVERLRAACASASPLRRWWLRRRLRALEREKVLLEQRAWRRRRPAAWAPATA
ncbi:MAG TPA: hypothetical protein VK002_01000 [Rubricoccaceae bacterium]|nr:hypothetical protein [Rubricoccaceae bacterium]